VQELLVPADVPPACVRCTSLIGFQRGLLDWFGVAVPFGSGEPQQWQTIAQLSEDFGSGEIRLTPSRAVLLPGVHAKDSAALGALARQSGLIVDADDPLLHVIACPGAPACRSAWGETRAFARSLCESLPRVAQDMSADTTLHVSGCSKSCASRSPAHITVVHDADGCKLGFGMDAIQTASLRATSIDSVLRHLKETASARR
jgi:precorrin-3B synthase